MKKPFANQRTSQAGSIAGRPPELEQQCRWTARRFCLCHSPRALSCRCGVLVCLRPRAGLRSACSHEFNREPPQPREPKRPLAPVSFAWFVYFAVYCLCSARWQPHAGWALDVHLGRGESVGEGGEYCRPNPTASKRRVNWEFDGQGRRIRQTTYDGSSGIYTPIEDLKFLSDAGRALLNRTRRTTRWRGRTCGDLISEPVCKLGMVLRLGILVLGEAERTEPPRSGL